MSSKIESSDPECAGAESSVASLKRLHKKEFDTDMFGQKKAKFSQNEPMEKILETNGSVQSSNVPIVNILKMNNKECIDVIGILTHVGKLVEVKSRTQYRVKNRDITLIDQSNESINVTLWARNAEMFDSECYTTGIVISFRNAAVKVYGGKVNLTCGNKTNMTIDPNTAEAQILRDWYITLKDAEELMANTSFGSCGSPPSTQINNLVVPSKNFVPINVIHAEKQQNDRFDVIGIVVKVKPVEERQILGKASKNTREIEIRADTDDVITATIWGGPEMTLSIPLNCGIIIKKVKVHIFDQVKKLNGLWAEVLIDSPDQTIQQFFKYYRERQKTLDMKKTVENVEENRNEQLKRKIHEKSTEELKSISIDTVKTVQEIEMDSSEIFTRNKISKTVKNNFSSIKTIKEDMKTGSIVDTIGMITASSKSQIITEQKKTFIQTVTLCNECGTQIDADLWDFQNSEVIPLKSIVSLKKAKVFDNGQTKKLSCPWSNVTINPKEPQADRIRQAIDFARESALENFTDNFKDYAQIDDDVNVAGTENDIEAVERKSNVNNSRNKDCDNETESGIEFTGIASILSDETISSSVNVLGIIVSFINYNRDVTMNFAGVNFKILDQTENTIKVSIWGEKAVKFVSRRYSVIALLNTKIMRHNDEVELHCSGEGIDCVVESPDYIEAKKLKIWYSKIANVKIPAVIPIATLLKTGDDITEYSLTGIVTKVSETFKLKIGCLEDCSRNIQLIDESGEEITLVTWGKDVSRFDLPAKAVVFISNIRFRKKHRYCLFDGNSNLQHPIDQCETLRFLSWYESYKGSKSTKKIMN